MVIVNNKYVLSLFMGLIAVVLPSISAAKVQAFLNQEQIYIDDAVTLTIETNANTNDNPDLSPLKKDFTIVGTSNRSHISIINGQTTAKKSWIIQLQPLRKGKLTIPAITLGKQQTQALTLTVTDVPADVDPSTQQHAFVEAAVLLKDNKQPYVQQQISYTVKLFFDDQLLGYDMYAPNIDNAVIEALQPKDRYRVTRDGKSYQVIERNYVISAEKSGELIIPPTIVKGRIRQQQANQGQQRQQNDPFFNDPFASSFFSSSSLFGERGKAITLRSQPITVQVQPLPTTFKGDNWLPAEEVKLKDSWQTTLPTFRVGEPVSRTLTIEAKGLASSQIPKLALTPLEAIHTYPEQDNNQNYTDGNTVIGERSQIISYMPNQAGEITLPEITLDWWNVVTKQQQTARLPAITIMVAEGSGATTNIVASSASTSTTSDPNSSDLANNHSNTTSSQSWWLIIGIIAALATAIFALIKNQTALLARYQQWRTKYQKSALTTQPSSQKQLYKHLQQACEHNNAPQAAHHLLALVQQQWTDHPPQSLGALAEQLATGADTVRQLDHSLYAANKTVWRGTALWELVSKHNKGLPRKQTIITAHNDGLDALYPAR